MNTEDTSRNPEPESPPASPAPMTERATTRAHELIEEAGRHASAMERELRARAAERRERLGEQGEAVAVGVEDSLATVEQFIRDNPLAAAGIAFAAGLLVSKILR